MRVSREKLLAEAAATGFRPEILEKVILLLQLLEGVNRHPFLAGKLALKGGTALNLFLFDLPRLSVDIDLNYVGAEARETMLAERLQVVESITAICRREGLTVRTKLDGHAGISWHLRYDSALGQQGNLKIDLNFMFRVPLWPVVRQDSRAIGSYQAHGIAVMDLHELAAGKLAALLSRHTSRDLFDAYELLVRGLPDQTFIQERLRLAFVIYGAINREDWRSIGLETLDLATQDLETYLVPLLREDVLTSLGSAGVRGRHLVDACRQALAAVLPLTTQEQAFLDRLLESGEIEPALLTQDTDLADRIRRHPGLAWKALNVRDYKRGITAPGGLKEDIEAL